MPGFAGIVDGFMEIVGMDVDEVNEKGSFAIDAAGIFGIVGIVETLPKKPASVVARLA